MKQQERSTTPEDDRSPDKRARYSQRRNAAVLYLKSTQFQRNRENRPTLALPREMHFRSPFVSTVRHWAPISECRCFQPDTRRMNHLHDFVVV